MSPDEIAEFHIRALLYGKSLTPDITLVAISGVVQPVFASNPLAGKVELFPGYDKADGIQIVNG